jgi:hypothetical protein
MAQLLIIGHPIRTRESNNNDRLSQDGFIIFDLLRSLGERYGILERRRCPGTGQSLLKLCVI